MFTPSPLEQLIATTSLLLAEMESRAIQDERFAELSMRQVFYLSTILRLEEPTFSDLARELKVTKPSVTALVGTLIAKGYVRKQQDSADRRIYHILPTAKGLEFNAIHEATHQRLAAFLSAHLENDEVETLARLLAKALQGAGE